LIVSLPDTTTLSPGSVSARAVADVSTRRPLSFFDRAENEPMLNRRSNVSRLTPTSAIAGGFTQVDDRTKWARRGNKYGCPLKILTILTSASLVQPILLAGEARITTVDTRAVSIRIWGQPGAD
jgi:hypothetical protein